MSTPPFDPRLRLLLITPDDMEPDRLLRQTQGALRGGVRAVQLRRKRDAGRTFFALADVLRRLTREYGALFFVNGRVDMARAVEADGVHCGRHELPLPVARHLVPDGLLGYSAHRGDSPEVSRQADFVTFSPVFESPGKGTPVGLEALREAVDRYTEPVLALGGIEVGNLSRVADTGVAGVAVIRAIYDADDPQGVASRLIGNMQEIWHAQTSHY